MTDQTGVSAELKGTLALVRTRIVKFREDKSFNEQNTKASLIVPVLQVLGWDTNDSEEVHWEYKPKPKYNPVDFALMLQRAPALFVEAKALRDNLRDDKLVAQILTYASVSGVQWVVLTNGDEYRIYNANAPVPIEDKLFRTVSVSSEPELIAGTLLLLSKRNLQEKIIDRLWVSNFVDRQVKVAIGEMFTPIDPAQTLVSAIKKQTQGKLQDSEIRASLRRARLQVDFPQAPGIEHGEAATRTKAQRSGAKRTIKKKVETASGRVSLDALIKEGLLPPPVRIFAKYRGHDIEATVEADGSITYDGKQYWTPSIAGGAARKPFHQGDLKGNQYPSTSGWMFWQIEDPLTRQPIALDTIRARYLEKKKAEALRFGVKDS